MKRTAKFIVEIPVPEGVSVVELREYVEEAVSIMSRSADPDDPIFGLDLDSVKVKRYVKRKTV